METIVLDAPTPKHQNMTDNFTEKMMAVLDKFNGNFKLKTGRAYRN